MYGENDNGSYDHLHLNKTHHWLRDGAPYRLTDNIIVWEHSSTTEHVSILKIYPGAVVAFEQNKSIYVGHDSDSRHVGALQADSVTFTSVDESVTGDQIMFRNFSKDDESYINASIIEHMDDGVYCCLLYTSPSPRDVEESRMPSSA